MTTNTINGRSFEVDEEGFFVKRDEWTEELARDLAPLIGIELDGAHLAPLRFMRKDSADNGVTPTLRRMQTAGGFDIKELFALYPGSRPRRCPGSRASASPSAASRSAHKPHRRTHSHAGNDPRGLHSPGLRRPYAVRRCRPHRHDPGGRERRIHGAAEDGIHLLQGQPRHGLPGP